MRALTIHVVGAGMAGLVAALHCARAGHAVCLHDAAEQAGGRCGTMPDGADTHRLSGTDAEALDFLAAIGARDGWIEPEPDGLPLLDLADGMTWRLAGSPRGWRDPARRPEALGAAGALALLGMAAGITDQPVADAMAKHPILSRRFVEPLALAALNTPVAIASSARMGQVLRRYGRAGGARLLVARDGLATDLILPALRAIRQAGANLRLGARLRAMTLAEDRVVALHVAQDTVVIGADAAVILALPPSEAARLVPGLRVPERHAPSHTLHFAQGGGAAVHLLGVLGGSAQWLLIRPGGISVALNPTCAQAASADDDVAARVWAEARIAARAFGLGGGWPDAPPPCRSVRDAQATLFHGVGQAPVAPRQPMRNLALAGDWTWPGLPSSIEAAALAGAAAARAVTRGR